MLNVLFRQAYKDKMVRDKHARRHQKRDSLGIELCLRLGAVHKVRHAVWPILTPSSVTPCHTSRDPQKSTSHISDPPIFTRPSTKTLTKTKKTCTNSLSIVHGGFVRGFCQGVFSLGDFVRGGFCSFFFCQHTSVTTDS